MDILTLLRRDAEACARGINPPALGSNPEDFLTGQAVVEIKRLRGKLKEMRHALEKLVGLNSFYAQLLNDLDGGKRMVFADADEWLARLRELK